MSHSVMKYKPTNVKSKIFYNKIDLEEHFEPAYYQRGVHYYRKGFVRKYNIRAYSVDDIQQLITGKVLGSQHKLYEVTAEVLFLPDEHDDSSIFFECYCNCPVGFDCKHSVALLLQVMAVSDYQSPYQAYQPSNTYDYLREQAKMLSQRHTTEKMSFTKWADAITVRKNEQQVKQAASDVILYLLDVVHYPIMTQLKIKPMLSRILKKGGYGKAKPYVKFSAAGERATTKEDIRLLALLESLQGTGLYNEREFSIDATDVDEVLIDLLKTQRVFWQNVGRAPLTLGQERPLKLQWKINGAGQQYLLHYIDEAAEHTSAQLLPASPLWYCDPINNTCGKLKSKLSADVVLSLLTLPEIEPNAVKNVRQQLGQLFPDVENLPMPIHVKAKKEKQMITPAVSVRLFAQETNEEGQYYYFSMKEDAKLAFVDLQFDYAGRTVTLNEANDVLSCYQEGQLLTIKRDVALEQHCVEKLLEADIEPFALNKKYHVIDTLRFSFLLAECDNNDNEQVILDKLSQIKKIATENNWQVYIDDSFPVQMMDEIDEWYSDLEEGSGIDWFSLTLGVVVNGEKVNLLPLLVDLIRHRFRQLDSQSIIDLPDDTPCPLKLDNGHYISVPFPRIRDVLLVLCELFDDKPLDEMGALRLSRLQAGLLAEIEKAMKATQLRWFGGERLRQFAQKLAHFEGIKTVTLSKTFSTQLRPYQQQGLNWMQFLREYGLGGILADDMGLGKTVQTLANFSVEKSNKRLQKPSLLVAPTSVVNNWAIEAERFSPNLKVLILQGADRKIRFSDIEKFDIVITTYPLISRDKEIILAHNYYYLILDEAQQIKNNKTKAAQILLQIQAQHRLCLTGTPMENHLGELWSLFNFILPGLLGNERHFKTVFRTPIERHGDSRRHQQLIARIKPFMLRRRKDEVVKELPKKTEIIRTIEIEGAQRDLYESVRLSMEQRVRDIVNEKGLNRSQIIILDALLKLRQICCAPYLLKLKTTKKDIPSAKLNDLMTFLPNLIEEGRKILLFSSFTSMLTLIEAKLKEGNIDYVKLTGKTRDRKEPIEQFQAGKIPLFLISLKAGGVGLNLTAADTVIHYDPWWNPAAEQQATDRAHRIGQKNPVFVYKLITKGTVEEKILEMQDKKRQLISGIIEQQAQKSIQLTQDDLNLLFQPIQ